ncbi:hypothetical protein [Aromatoleum buckelii]|uniref:Uncharacterized protein n=1 Tax=Aromatoleum buckelii TaxID=200254 RepID=A0ABX1N3D9_9RHOO|nr:hypothetical protein [Aromatoleum buckelii]MCK0510791.1 hypothetical protein [Aromatoleum buckelii]
MTDYANFRSALNAIVKTLAPHHASDGRRAMAGKLAEAATGKTIENLAFRYRDIGRLFFPHDEAAAIELGERISAARRAGEIASIIPFGDNGLLPTDLLTWANCPPVRASNPLSHWLPITEHDAPGNDAPLAVKETAPAPPAAEDAQEPSGAPDPWIVRAREHADNIWLRELGNNKRPAKESIAPEIAGRLWRDDKMVTRRRARITADYIVSHALNPKRNGGWEPPVPE